jgi:hypothetical protein
MRLWTAHPPRLQVGVAHAQEAATNGVDEVSPPAAGPGGLRAFGGAASSASGPSSGSQGIAKSRAADAARSELFSRPARKDASGDAGDANAFVSVPGKPAASFPADDASAAPTGNAPTDDASDYDYASAFAAMGGIEEHEEDGVAESAAVPSAVSSPGVGSAPLASSAVAGTACSSGPSPGAPRDSAPFSVPPPQASPEEDLGLL